MIRRRSFVLSTVLLTFAITGCRQPQQTVPAATPGSDDPRTALARLTTMLEHRDPALVDEFVDDPDVLIVGSEASEIEIGREQIAQMVKALSAGPAVRFNWTQTRSGSHGDVAWLFASGDVVVTDHGTDTRVPYRLTGVLERRNGAWKWRQFHGSEPAVH